MLKTHRTNAMVENQRASRPATSRRTLLKTIGGTSIAATALSGTSAAATDAGFHCSFHFPSLFKDNEAPLDPGFEDDIGVVNNSYPADGIFIPDSAKGTDCDLFGNCDKYQIEIPFIISWKTDADPSDIGNVVARVDARAPGESGNGAGAVGYNFSEQENVITDEVGGLGLTATYTMKTGLSSKLFRPLYLDMELDFSDSNIAVDASDDVLTNTSQWATPNKGQINVENLISKADTTWNTGVDIADRFVRNVDLGKLQTAARLWAYSSVAAADMLDGSDLPRDAAVEGISAFEEPIEENTMDSEDWQEEYIPTTAGPTIVRKN